MSLTSAPSSQKTVRQAVDTIGRLEQLDGVGEQLERLLRPRLESRGLRNALSGVWLGHRLHPMLTDVAIGAFTGAALVDGLAPRHPQIARRLIAAGVMAAVPTAASGMSDWIDVYGDARRIGLVHAAGNSLALGLFGISFLHRGRRHKESDRHGGGRLSSFAGLAVLAATGYLGGHLSYVLGVGVDHTAFEPRIEDWTDVAAAEEVLEGGHKVARAGEVEVLLTRTEGELHAMANRCSHAGWGLDPGKFEDGCVTCPAHGSRFRLDDGSVVRGPAASPQPVFEVRAENGRIEVRSRKG